jgi:hypothetical protein
LALLSDPDPEMFEPVGEKHGTLAVQQIVSISWFMETHIDQQKQEVTRIRAVDNASDT